MRIKIASSSSLSSAQRARIESACPDAEIADLNCRTPEDVAALASGCDVLLTFLIPPDLLERAPGLKWVQLLSAGADRALASPLNGGRVSVTTGSGIHCTPIAEYT